MTLENLVFVLPAIFIGVAGLLIQSSLRYPHVISWWRLASGIIIVLGVCFGLAALASVGGLAPLFALILGSIATLPALISGVWIAWSAPRWRKLAAPLVGLLIPFAFWISIWQGDAQSPENITQRHGDQIVHALETFHTVQQSYPAALTALVPIYLPNLPVALTTQGTGWLYDTDSHTYTLGYWHYPGKYDVILCRFRSTSSAWNCGVTDNTPQGWAPFRIVWTPTPTLQR